jgi:hypothetical protein
MFSNKNATQFGDFLTLICAEFLRRKQARLEFCN